MEGSTIDLEQVMHTRTLPDYENPPAVETALGVRFSPIPNWNVFHYGLLLAEFEQTYPRHELRPPIGEVNWQFPPQGDFANVPVRCWFINADDTQLVQVQNNCFIRNWRKTDKTPDYLHYDVVRPLFESDWERFTGFLRRQKLSLPNVWQCEVSYINHLVRGRDWSEFSDIENVLPSWRGMPAEGLFARPEMVTFAVSYALPDVNGHLQFAAQPGVRQSDGAEIIQLTITASSKPPGSTMSEILSRLDACRAAVVNGFAGFASEPVQKLVWKRR
jgi:uncharacterized protein (TIGR04255 family)